MFGNDWELEQNKIPPNWKVSGNFYLIQIPPNNRHIVAKVFNK